VWKWVEQAGARQFEYGDGLAAGNAGEIVEESFQGIASFEVIEEGLDRDTGAGKAWSATHSLGIDPDDVEEGVGWLDQITDEIFSGEGSAGARGGESLDGHWCSGQIIS
jgi:hypothetical protein